MFYNVTKIMHKYCIYLLTCLIKILITTNGFEFKFEFKCSCETQQINATLEVDSV